jgi:hypothetical protein
MRDLLAAKLDDVLLGGDHAAAQPDASADSLTVLRVGDTHHGHIEHRRMPIEKIFDLPRIDVLTAADDHVLHSADDVAVALLVDDGQIPRVHPAPRVDGVPRTLGIVPVAAHDAVTAG